MRKSRSKRIKNNKPLFAVISAILVVALLVGGAFAWTDFTQSKTNKFKGTTDADVTLHDEFDGINKDVFVENSGTSVVYVRIRLDEYMEIGGKSFVSTADVKDKSTWTPHTYEKPSIEDCEQIDNAHLFHSYYKWEMSGADRKYLPGTPGLVYSKLKETTVDGKTIEVVDTNPNGGLPTLASNAPITMSEFIRLESQAYENMTQTDKNLWDSKVKAGCWILDDTDVPENGGAWAYWSQPLAPGTATNLLLDSVTKTSKEPSDDWFYGIDVKLQAVTSNDFEKWNNGADFGYKLTPSAQKLVGIWQ